MSNFTDDLKKNLKQAQSKVSDYLSSYPGQSANTYKSDQNLMSKGMVPLNYTPSQTTPADVLQPITSQLPNWGVGNPIQPQGFDTANIAHQLLGGSRTPQELSLIDKYKSGNTDLNPDELKAARKLSDQQQAQVMMTTSAPQPNENVMNADTMMAGDSPPVSAINSRPQSQVDLENAWNTKDFNKAQDIINSLNDTDPYKAPMQDLQLQKVATEGKVMDLSDPNQYDRIASDAIHTNPELFKKSFTQGDSYQAVNSVLKDSLGKLGYDGVRTPEGITVFGSNEGPDIVPDPVVNRNSLGEIQGEINSILQKNQGILDKSYMAPINEMDALRQKMMNTIAPQVQAAEPDQQQYIQSNPDLMQQMQQLSGQQQPSLTDRLQNYLSSNKDLMTSGLPPYVFPRNTQGLNDPETNFVNDFNSGKFSNTPDVNKITNPSELVAADKFGTQDISNLTKALVAGIPGAGLGVEAMNRVFHPDPSWNQEYKDQEPMSSFIGKSMQADENGNLPSLTDLDNKRIDNEFTARADRQDPVNTALRNGADWLFNHVKSGNISQDYSLDVMNDVAGKLGLTSEPLSFTPKYGPEKGNKVWSNPYSEDYYSGKREEFKKDPIGFFKKAADDQKKVTSLRQDILSQTNYTPEAVAIVSKIPIVVLNEQQPADYDSKTNTIYIGDDILNDNFGKGNNKASAIKVLRHELDHAVDSNLGGKYQTSLSNSQGFAKDFMSSYASKKYEDTVPNSGQFTNYMKAEQGHVLGMNPSDPDIQKFLDSEMFAEYGASEYPELFSGADPTLVQRYKNIFMPGTKIPAVPPTYPQ